MGKGISGLQTGRFFGGRKLRPQRCRWADAPVDRVWRKKKALVAAGTSGKRSKRIKEKAWKKAGEGGRFETPLPEDETSSPRGRM